MSASNTAERIAERYGPWALLVGGSEGIGGAMAADLASFGLNLVLVALPEPRLDAIAERLRTEHGVQVRTLGLDVSDEKAVDSICAAVEDVDLGLYVNLAAGSAVRHYLETSEADLLRVCQINVTVPLLLIRRIGSRLAARGRGGIVVVTSGAGLQGMENWVTYAATKAYQIILGEGLWAELREHGVDAMSYVVSGTFTRGFARTLGLNEGEKPPTMTDISTPAEVAARLWEVLGTGPRGYARPDTEARLLANASRPRADVVTEVSAGARPGGR